MGGGAEPVVKERRALDLNPVFTPCRRPQSRPTDREHW